MYTRKLVTLIVCILVIGIMSFTVKSFKSLNLNGAWLLESNAGTEVLIFTDGYFSHTAYNSSERKFQYTYGGTCRMAQNTFTVHTEFDTRYANKIGSNEAVTFNIDGSFLLTEINGQRQKWKKLDNANAPLSGAWHITQRMQNGQLQTIHQTGTRKTIKLLTGSRFQWVAIDPALKEFYGTGGGIYTFKNGKYTEQILFFSRDSSRVSASLQFDGKVIDGQWHHSGKSSKGDDIYEVWSRVSAKL